MVLKYPVGTPLSSTTIPTLDPTAPPVLSVIVFPVTYRFVKVAAPAAKLPDPSRATIALAVLASVAVVASFKTKPAVDNVTNLSFAIVPTIISPSTTEDDESSPDPLA